MTTNPTVSGRAGKPTNAQRRVLAWLIAYPQVFIQCLPRDNARPRWSTWWRSEAARKQMVAVLGDDCTAPVIPTTGGTPRLTDTTFRVLIRRGWIRVASVRPRDEVMTAMNYFQITESGETAVMIR